MRKRKPVKAPPIQGVVSIRDSAAFLPDQATQIVQAIGKPAFHDATWIAEALNEATEEYYATFAIAQTGTPSEQAEWANALKTAAERCLQMLVPNGPISERPQCADHRVQGRYSMLANLRISKQTKTVRHRPGVTRPCAMCWMRYQAHCGT